MRKKRLISENNMVFILNDMESKTDSENRDRLLQIQLNKVMERLQRLEKVNKK